VAKLRIHGFIADVRKLDDESVAFVRRSLHESITSIEDATEKLLVLGKTWPALAIDMLVQHAKHRRILRMSHGFVTNHDAHADEHKALAGTVFRYGRHFRLPPNGYTQERLDHVTELAKQFDYMLIPTLIEYLSYSTSGASLEDELRFATYDALTHYDTDEVRSLLVAALRTEPEHIAHSITDGLYRAPSMMMRLPELIDAAWKPPRDEQLARRLLRALVKGDAECAHKTWVLANYRVLLQSTGVAYD